MEKLYEELIGQFTINELIGQIEMDEDNLEIFYEEILENIEMLIRAFEVGLKQISITNDKHKEAKELELEMLKEFLLISKETLCLMENGYINGASARFRALIEYKYIMDFIELFNDRASIIYNLIRAIKFYIRTREIKGTTFSNRIKEKIYIKYSAALHKDKITSLMSKKYINDYEWARIILKEKGFISHKEKISFKTILEYVEEYYNKDNMNKDFFSEYYIYSDTSRKVHAGNTEIDLEYDTRFTYYPAKGKLLTVFNSIIFRTSMKIIANIKNKADQEILMSLFCEIADIVDNKVINLIEVSKKNI